MKSSADLENSDADHLYLMSACPGTLLPGLVKIGRSKNPQQRAIDLQESQPYHLVIHAIYWGAGPKERAVHSALSAFRVAGAPGVEWFELPLASAALGVSRIIFSETPAPPRRRAHEDDAECVEPGE